MEVAGLFCVFRSLHSKNSNRENFGIRHMCHCVKFKNHVIFQDRDNSFNRIMFQLVELESHLFSMEQRGGKEGNEEVMGKVRELERLVRCLRQEKETVVKEKQDVEEKLKMQEKELTDALSQRKLAMTEYTEVTDRYVRSFKAG